MDAGKYHLCLTFVNSTEYQSVIVNIRVAVSSFSFLGSLFVIGLIWLFKKHKFFVQRLILYLSISAFISSIAYTVGRVNYDPASDEQVWLCEAQGFFLLYSDWTVVLSILCITINILLSVFIEHRIKGIEWIFVSVIFLLPLPISCIPFYHSSFGPSGVWCWIRTVDEHCTRYVTGEYLQFIVWYVPQYTLILVLFIMYIIIITRVKAKARVWQGIYDPNVEYRNSLIKKEVKSLIWYPTVYFLITFFPLVNRIVSVIMPTPYLSLYILHVLTSPLQGAFTALVYALDKDTLQRLRWRKIRASLKYRNTDNIVKEYSVGPPVKEHSGNQHTDESQPFLSEQSYQGAQPSTSPTRKAK